MTQRFSFCLCVIVFLVYQLSNLKKLGFSIIRNHQFALNSDFFTNFAPVI